jgi:N-acetylmuramoyl-L-alanine amidase
VTSPNHGERRGGVRPHLIVLHYTGMPTFAEARARLCDPVHEVSAHWLLDTDGRAEPLVDEARRAWHAGAGAWGGITDVNSASIGIELHNPGRVPFAAAQMTALEALLTAIMARWQIAPAGVIAHSDMAPTRKSDPGPHFDWRRLALGGLSVWPKAQTGRAADFWHHAQAFGYPATDAAAVLHAFRLRFRPWASGPVDAVDAGLAADLATRFPALKG